MAPTSQKAVPTSHRTEPAATPRLRPGSDVASVDPAAATACRRTDADWSPLQASNIHDLLSAQYQGHHHLGRYILVAVSTTTVQERGLERLISFSDGVVAIAITLLVLPLTELEPDPGQSSWDFLRSHTGELLAFAISFLVIARFWFTHHAMINALTRIDTPLLLINTGWLASLVLLPFPTALLEDDPSYATLYLINLMATSVMSSGISAYIRRHPELLATPTSTAHARADRYFNLAVNGIIMFALIGSLFWSSTAMLLLLLIPLARRITSRTIGSDPTAS